jgi:hypothetical protein
MVSLSQLIDQKGKFFQCFKYSGKSTALLVDFAKTVTEVKNLSSYCQRGWR